MESKKKKNGGFTLIELLAVVVILLAISVMAISSISAAIERNKKKQNDTKINVIKSYAELYYNDNKNSLDADGCIKILDLYSKGIISKEEATDADGVDFIPGGIRYTSGKNFTYDKNCS